MVRLMATCEFDWVEMYWSLLLLNGDRFKRMLEVLAHPGSLPALVHCTGGRDRSGVTVALVQAAIGVREDAIAADFARSSEMLASAGGRTEFERLFSTIELPREDILRAMTTPARDHARLVRAHPPRPRQCAGFIAHVWRHGRDAERPSQRDACVALTSVRTTASCSTMEYRGPLKAVIFAWAGTTVDFGSRAPVMAFVRTFEWLGSH